MALDKDGRPIPVSVPEPEDNSGQPTEDQRQFKLVQDKVDSALAAVTDFGRRLVSIEAEVSERLDTKTLEFEHRVDAAMLDLLKTFRQEFDSIMEPWKKPPPERYVGPGVPEGYKYGDAPTHSDPEQPSTGLPPPAPTGPSALEHLGYQHPRPAEPHATVTVVATGSGRRGAAPASERTRQAPGADGNVPGGRPQRPQR
jgi:hypothetical protein